MIDPKYVGSIYLYNMLQDFRHLLIFDFRKGHSDCNIRDSFEVREPKEQQKNIVQVIELANKKAIQKEKKYQGIKKVRRYFFIDQEKLNLKDNRIMLILQYMNKHNLKDKDDKYYVLSEPFSSFYQKYHFMCLESKKLEGITDQKQKQRILLYPYSKFPAQIIPNTLYLGNVYNSNSEIQLKDLGINGLFDFIDYNNEQKIPSFKSVESLYTYFHLPFNKQVMVQIDFDWVNNEIDKIIAQSTSKKILLYCKDGETVSAAFAISYLMYKCGLDITMATLKVCQAISRVQIDKNIYSQLLLYKPTKK